jgi:hypothetical protein
MDLKVLEIRDDGTFIPVLCVNMNPSGWGQLEQKYLLRRCGYPCDGQPNIGITHLNADSRPFNNDPFAWGGRTYPVAHKHIIENWETLKDGDVVDVEFILGETKAPKVSERVS